MGHKHDRDDMLAGALEVAMAEGLSRLTFGRVGKHLGISDRTVVYYFPTKDDLIREVLQAVGAGFQATLAPAFATAAADHVQVVRTAWPLATTGDADAVFALFFEANGLAASGREPYRSVVRDLVDAWVRWTSEFIDGDDERRRSEAEAAIALLDGLLLLRQLAGADAAERAALTMGVT